MNSIDFIKAFTDLSSPLASNLDAEVVATKRLLDASRLLELPIAFTTVEYDEGFRDAGVFIKKVPSLSVLKKGTSMVEVDDRLKPMANEHILVKKYASAFFGTSLASTLTAAGIDTLLITGCTTSGCVRASAVDACQYGFRAMVIKETVGDPLRKWRKLYKGAALGILMSLYYRDVKGTGQGQMVDVAIYESCFNLMESLIPEYDKLGEIRERQGAKLTGIAPTNTYPTEDGKFIIIGGNGDSIFKRLMTAAGREDLANDPRLATNEGRVGHEPEIDAALEAWTRSHPYDSLIAALEEAEVPSGPIYSAADTVNDPHYQARGMFEDADIGDGETVKLPKQVVIMDVSPRDGLQSEPVFVATEKKIALINALIAAGVRHIEATSFVSPKWVPQMADAEAVMAAVGNRQGVTIEALTPNEKGYDRAKATGLLKEVGFVVAATETLNVKNVNMSGADSMKHFAAIAEKAKADGVQVRGTIGVAFVCPYEGRVPMERTLNLADQYFRLGADEACLADTVGRAMPDRVYELFSRIKDRWANRPLAGHFHDTHQHGLANIFAALQAGVAIFDAAVGNLGGCQFAKGATGNIATERVVYLLNGMGIETGIDYDRLLDAARFARSILENAKAN